MLHYLLLICGFIMAESGELPNRFDIQSVKLKSIPYSQQLTLRGSVEIPDGYKHAQRATLHIYEKQEGGWVHTAEVAQDPIKGMFSLDNDMHFNKSITLKSDKNDVAFDLSVSFCNKICVINNFQGIAKRDTKAKANRLEFQVRGQLPSERMKKDNKI